MPTSSRQDLESGIENFTLYSTRTVISPHITKWFMKYHLYSLHYLYLILQRKREGYEKREFD